MASNKICVRDINGDSENSSIEIQILNIWKQNFRNNNDVVASIEIIIADEHGHKIQGTIKRNLIPEFEDSLEQGSFIELSKFGVGANDGNYLLVAHAHKINFLKCTKIKTIQAFSHEIPQFTFTSFSDIINDNINTQVSLDVIGHVVHMGDMKIINGDNKGSRFITFHMQDLSGLKLDFTLWDDFATQLYNNISTTGESTGPIVVLINNAKYKKWASTPQISNSLFGSRVFINADIPAINNYKSRLCNPTTGNEPSMEKAVFKAKTIVSHPVDYYSDVPVVPIDEVRNIMEPTVCVILAKVLKFQKDDGWFYLACRRCGKKIENKDKSLTSDGPFNCAECGEIKRVYGRIRLQLRVQDTTGVMSVVLFDRLIPRLLNRGLNYFESKMISHSNTQEFPDEFDTILKKWFAIKIQVSTFNIKHNYPSYTVLRLTEEPLVVNYVKEKLQEVGIDFGEDDTEHNPNGVDENSLSLKPESDKVITDIDTMDGDDNHPSPINFIHIPPVHENFKRKSSDVIDCDAFVASTSTKHENEGKCHVSKPKKPKLEKP